MTSALLHEHAGQKTFVVVFETGEEMMSGFLDFCRQQSLAASHLTAIGAFERATVAYFDWQTKEYRKIPIAEQVEVLALSGDVSVKDGEPQVHAHVVLGKADATAHGGHLIEAVVRPTLELVVVESPSYLKREMSSESGLALINPRATRP